MSNSSLAAKFFQTSINHLASGILCTVFEASFSKKLLISLSINPIQRSNANFMFLSISYELFHNEYPHVTKRTGNHSIISVILSS